MKPFGNTENPKLIVVLPHPDLAEWKHQKYMASESRHLFRQFLNGKLEDTYVTSITKQVEYKDQIATQLGLRKPSETELTHAMPSLKSEIEKFTNAVIMPIGQDALKAFGFEGKISDFAGRELKWNGCRIIPNYDPLYIKKKTRLVPNFGRYIAKAFKAPEEKVVPEYKTLAFKEAVYEIKRAYDLWSRGEIDYMVFDTETTSFDAWDGKLIMYSWAHTKNHAGYAFPLVVNNNITVNVDKFIRYSGCESELKGKILSQMTIQETSHEILKPVKRAIMSEMSKEEKKELREKRAKAKQIIEQETTAIYQREKDKIQIGFEVTPQQAEQFNILLGKILKEVPIVGHNLKFDAKWLHEHDICSLRDLKIKDDTMLMGYMIFNKEFGSNLRLETLVNKYFKIDWKDEVADYISMYPRLVDRNYGNVPTGILGGYAGKDAYFNMRLYEKLKEEFPEESEYITDIVTQANNVFAKIELQGLKVDQDMYQFLKANYEKTCANCLAELNKLPIVQAYQKKHGKFNPNSGDQLRVLLFDKMFYDLPNIRRKGFVTDKKMRPTDSQNKLSTDKNVIAFFIKLFEESNDGTWEKKRSEDRLSVPEKCVGSHIANTSDAEILFKRWTECETFLKHYKLYKRIGGKLLPTYINPVPEMSPNGLYRPSYSLIATATGRVGCLTGDTKIPLLDGSTVEIKDLPKGYKSWILGCEKDGTIVPCEFTSLGVKKHTKMIYKITLDNDEVVKTTSNHKFMLRDGSYKEAKDLEVNQSLMPAYTGRTPTDYQMVFDNSKKEWKSIHRIVGEDLYAKQLGILGSNSCLHHVDQFPEEIFQKAAHYNHKIKSIEIETFDQAIPVYDLNVPRTSNFILDSGIFVHNSGFHTMDQGSEITRMFISRWREQGGLILAPDYSQIEVRIVASLAGEDALIEAYDKGYDIHATTASKTYKIPIEDVTHQQRQHGKCVDPNTWVYVDGSYKRIGSLFSGREKDVFYDPKYHHQIAINEKQVTKVNQFYSNGEADRVLVCARRGMIACSKNHRFVLEDGALKRAGDLEKGDKLKETSRIETKGQPQTIEFNHITNNLAYCLGVFLGDGCSHKTFVEICCGGSREYGQYREEILKAFSDIGFEPRLKKEYINKLGGHSQNIYLGSSNVVKFLSQFGVIDSQGSKNLAIPDYILQSERATRLEFLAGLLDTDGSVAKAGDVEFTTKSWILAQDVMTLCQSLGMICSLDPSYNKKYERYYFRIRFAKRTIFDVKKYLRFEKKKERMTEPKFEYTKFNFPNAVQTIIPLPRGDVIDLEVEHEDHLYLTNGLLTHNTLNFFTIYGGGPEALADELKIPVDEAKKILENFFKGYPKLKQWADKQKTDLKKNGFILTKWGRKIPVPDINSEMKGVVAHALRAATNYPVQSSASDCVLYSLVRVEQEFTRQKMRSVLIGSVHDSIEVDVFPGELFRVLQIFRSICDSEVQEKHKWIRCPLKTSVELGSSWGGAIEFDIESLSENSIELRGSGLRKDFNLIKTYAGRKYKVDLHVIKRTELTEADFGPEHFFRDCERWDARLRLEI